MNGRSNVFLLKNEKWNILIDTSVSWNRKKLESQLKKLNINNIDLIIITHTHFDHVTNAGVFKEKYNSKILVHHSEVRNIEKGFKELPMGTNLVTQFLIDKIGYRLMKLFSYTPCTCDIIVESFFDLKPFGFDAYIMHTPGHSIGSISVIVDNEIAIVGDAMFGLLPWSVFPPFADDVSQMVIGWGILLETGCTIFLPAHGRSCSRELLKKEYSKKVSKLQINL